MIIFKNHFKILHKIKKGFDILYPILFTFTGGSLITLQIENIFKIPYYLSIIAILFTFLIYYLIGDFNSFKDD